MGNAIDVWCPVCRIGFPTVLRDVGDQCGSTLQGQPTPCPGWTLPWDPALIPFFRPPLDAAK